MNSGIEWQNCPQQRPDVVISVVMTMGTDHIAHLHRWSGDGV